MAFRKYDTCFFERYAMLSLQTILGHKFDGLVNVDRPDLQSADGRTLGIEVTRAMEEGRASALHMLKGIAGVSGAQPDIASPGYSYGLHEGLYVGGMEIGYWKTALPMQKIIRSKVSKVASGFYGDYSEFGLFIFTMDPLTEREAAAAMMFTMDLQKENDVKYSRLFLYSISRFYVCNLEDGISMDFRMMDIDVSLEQRRDLFLNSIDYRLR